MKSNEKKIKKETVLLFVSACISMLLLSGAFLAGRMAGKQAAWAELETVEAGLLELAFDWCEESALTEAECKTCEAFFEALDYPPVRQ
jgi:CelD/BcsL family acetyltransferase involved in cellulose biosynthesis